MRKHHDGHKGVSRRESFKLSHVIQDRLAKGGSSQGFGPHASQANSLTTLEALPEEPISPQVCHTIHLLGSVTLKQITTLVTMCQTRHMMEGRKLKLGQCLQHGVLQQHPIDSLAHH